MKRSNLNMRNLLSCFSLALCLNACSPTPATLKKPNMNDLSPRLLALFETPKTICFGRFILTIPSTATVVFGPGAADGGDIEYYPGAALTIETRIAVLLREIEKDREFLDTDDLERFALFGKVINGALPTQKLVFGSRDHATYSIDSFISKGNDLFIQSAVSAVSKDETISRQNNTARHLRIRAEDEVPTEPGICIDGGFLASDPKFEKVAIGIRLKEFPDVHLSVEVIKNQDYLVDSNELQPRLAGAARDGGTLYSRIKFLRRGDRQLGDWKGYEVLARKPAQVESTESHEFHFMSLGARNDPLQPQLDIQLNTGVKEDRAANVKPSITDDEAVALWDKLTNSIRVRPTGHAAKQTEATLPKAPLGTFMDTGSTCPQTGLWQCSEGGDFAGGRRRHFTAGQYMPHAVLLGKPGVWQTLKGERPTHEIATVWQLVEYDPVPAVPKPQMDPGVPHLQNNISDSPAQGDGINDGDPSRLS